MRTSSSACLRQRRPSRRNAIRQLPTPAGDRAFSKNGHHTMTIYRNTAVLFLALSLGALLAAPLSAAAAEDELSEDQIRGNLQGLAANAPVIDPAILAQEALAHVGKPK